ncbi:MAG: hypothetical protein UD963_12235, partial [Christensenellales bacterium]|nr:hypothetical protein [Christensenellales bacterium]
IIQDIHGQTSPFLPPSAANQERLGLCPKPHQEPEVLGFLLKTLFIFAAEGFQKAMRQMASVNVQKAP